MKVKTLVVAVLTCCFRRVGPICRCYDHINRSCSCLTRSIDHQQVRRYAPFHSMETCARLALRDSLWMFFAYKKMLGRTETRTRDRMYCQMIRTVRDISRITSLFLPKPIALRVNSQHNGGIFNMVVALIFYGSMRFFACVCLMCLYLAHILEEKAYGN